MLDTHLKSLLAIDREWVIEHAWFRNSLGESSQQALEKQWLAVVFPGVSLELTLEKACESSKKFMGGEMYLFASTASKSAIQGGHGMLKTMLDGHPPPADASTTRFTSSLLASLPTLVSRKVKVKSEPSEGSTETSKTVTGKEALMLDWSDVQKKQAKGAVKLEDLKDLMRFRHLLDADVATEVIGISNEVYKKVNKRKIPLEDLPKDAELKGKKPKKAAKFASSEADSLAMDLLAM
eukprot:6491046-Amphidinium_carterae.2